MLRRHKKSLRARSYRRATWKSRSHQRASTPIFTMPARRKAANRNARNKPTKIVQSEMRRRETCIRSKIARASDEKLAWRLRKFWRTKELQNLRKRTGRNGRRTTRALTISPASFSIARDVKNKQTKMQIAQKDMKNGRELYSVWQTNQSFLLGKFTGRTQSGRRSLGCEGREFKSAVPILNKGLEFL